MAAHAFSSASTSAAASATAAADADATQAKLQLHRLRFVDWTPTAITALAFSPSNPSAQPAEINGRGLLAIGRDNGCIDLCVWTEDTQAGSSTDLGGTKGRAPTSLAKGWMVDTTLFGPSSSKVDSLCWALSPSEPSPITDYPQPRQLRLFSSAGGASVTEHALPSHLLGTSQPVHSTNAWAPWRALPSLGGAVWSLSPSPLGHYLAVGCEDGFVRIVDVREARFEHLVPSRAARRTADGGVRGVATRMDRAKSRVLSLAWGPPKRILSAPKGSVGKKAAQSPAGRGGGGGSDSDDSEDDDGDDDEDDDDDDGDEQLQESFLVGGTSTSHACTWDVTTGRLTNRLSVPRARGEQTLVWSVLALPDSTCVLGDSNGRVTFFDGRTRVAIPGASFQSHGAGADVLALVAGPDGRSVYSGAVDQKVCELALLGGGDGAGAAATSTARWVQTGSRRLHAHDVRALAVEPPLDLCHHAALDWAARSAKPGRRPSYRQTRLPILASGGVDFYLVLTPASSPSLVNTAASGGSRRDARLSRKGITMAAPQQHQQKGLEAVGNPRASRQSATTKTYDASRDALNPISSNALTTFADTTQRRVAFAPPTDRGGALGGGRVVCVARQRGWVVLRRRRGVAVWTVQDRHDGRVSADFAGADVLLRGWTAQDVASAGAPPAPGRSFRKLLEMEPKLRTDIVCVAVSDDGHWLALSDLYETKLFELRSAGTAAQLTLQPRRVKSLAEAVPVPASSAAGQSARAVRVAPASSALAFTPDCQRLVLATYPASLLHVVELPARASGGAGEAKCRLLKTFSHHRRQVLPGARAEAGRRPKDVTARVNGHAQPNGRTHASEDQESSEDEERSDEDDAEGLDQDARPSSAAFRGEEGGDRRARVDVLAVSADGQYLLSADQARRTHVFSLDALVHHRTLPSSTAAASGAAFDVAPPRLGRVAMVLPTNRVGVYDVEREATTGASVAAPTNESLERAVNEKLADVRESAVGCRWIRVRVRLAAPASDAVDDADDAAAWVTTSALVVYGASWICTAIPQNPSAEVTRGTTTTTAMSTPTGARRTAASHTHANGSVSAEATKSARRKRGGARSGRDEDDAPGGSPDDAAPTSAASAWRVRITTGYQALLYVGALTTTTTATTTTRASVGAPVFYGRPDDLAGGERRATGDEEREEDALVAVERPFATLVATMPAAYRRASRYGT